MRALACMLVATTGCALVDAGGESHGGGGGGGGLSFETVNIPNVTGMPKSVAFVELTETPTVDAVVIGSDGRLIAVISNGDPRNYEIFDNPTLEPPRQPPAPYTTVGHFDLDANGRDEVFVGGVGVLDLLTTTSLGIDGPRFTRKDLSSFVDPDHAITKAIANRLPVAPMPVIVVMYEGINKVTVITDPLGNPSTVDLMDANPADIAIGDVNISSPDPELIVGDLSLGRILEYNGNPLTPRSVGLLNGAARVMTLTVGAFGADGDMPDGGPDVAFTEQQGGTPNIGRVFYGNGNGLATSNQAFGEAMGAALVMKTGDFNGDGKADVVVLTENPSELRLFLQGATAFPTESRIALSGGPLDIAARDIDGDGRTDLAVAPGKLGGVDVYLSR